MHQLTYAFNACAARWSASFDIRRQLDELDPSIQSTPSTKTSIMTSLQADAYALQSLGKFEFFGLFSWEGDRFAFLALVSRGTVSVSNDSCASKVRKIGVVCLVIERVHHRRAVG